MTQPVPESQDSTLWYQRPAERWDEGFPLANGRIGAMVYGGARVERLFLSETTFWSGEASLENNNPEGPAIFRQIRELLQARQIAEANQLARELEGRKLNYGTNLPFGNLRMLFDHMELEAQAYRRELDLETGVAQVSYRVGAVAYAREIFISAPQQVLVVRLTASQPAMLSLRVMLDGDEQPFTVRAAGDDSLLMDNQARERQHSDGLRGVDGHARLRVLAEGGKVSASGAQLDVQGANAVTLLLAMGTTFGGGDPRAACQAHINAAVELSYEQLRHAHTSEHQGWMGRCCLDLGKNPHSDWPVDLRIEAARQGADDPHLCALLFQLGRYMILGSSRPDSPLPAHLLGAWNDNKACRIGWTADYHLDINTQMNYWITELSGLGECQLPLIHFVADTLVPSGRVTAGQLYGLPGWVAHIFTNAWGFTAWGWSTYWGVFPTGGVWLAMHLWDHYTFSGDREYLANLAYPVLKEAAEFCLAYLFDDPRTGYLVSGPANSPENAFSLDEKVYTVTLSPTVDRVLIDELFEACIEAGLALGINAEFAARLAAARAKLPPYQVGQHGQLQEWLEDYEEAVPGHRHTSHLLGLYPFAQITPRETPALAQAARVTIERRVNAPDYEEGAWARNNITLFYARLGDGEAAYRSLTTLFRHEAGDSLLAGTRLAPAGAYEMDYNTGAAAGIAEMLLHSHHGRIALLPALPKAWPQGSVSGLCARGGFEVAMRWQNHQLAQAQILSKQGGECQLDCGGTLTVTCNGQPVTTYRPDQGTIAFTTAVGQLYEIQILSQ